MDQELLDVLGLTPESAAAIATQLADREAEEVLESGPKPASEIALEAARDGQALAVRVSQRAFELITTYETGGRAYYERVIKQRPIWPEGKSGITIGFGYDLGYVSREKFRRDWSVLPAADLAALETTVGFHPVKDSAARMRSLLAAVDSIIVDWATAETVFKALTLPEFARTTFVAVPRCDLLSGDCFGILVSLTFNRGPSYARAHDPAKDPKDRYREMREIKAAMSAGRFSRIPGLLREMKRIWVGTTIETGMNRRREDEARLFETGLATVGADRETGAVVLESAELEVHPGGTHEAKAVVEAGVIPPFAETWLGAGDEDLWVDVTEDDVAAEAAKEGAKLRPALEVASIGWPDDDDSIDYAHLGIGLVPDVDFILRAADLELLATLNDFPVDEAGSTPILFGLRGCTIVRDHESSPAEVVLRDKRPDHQTPRCVLGVWSRTAGTIAVFPGSTVPNAKAMRNHMTTGGAGNLLPTGLYRYVVGSHNGRPGCFVLRAPDGTKRVVVVRRSRNDLVYDLTDVVDRCAPGDNLHPTFFRQPVDFSSFGCQTVVGSANSTGVHVGPWAAFRRAAGLTDGDGVPGTPYLYILLAGAEARLASEMRRAGLDADPQSRHTLRRLRFGARGARVERLQAKLGLSNTDGDFGGWTAETVSRLQAEMPPGGRADSIWTPRLDAAKEWGVFGLIGA